MMEIKLTLEEELKLEGASPTEARQLAEMAGRLPRLRQLPPPPLDMGFGSRQIKRHFWWRRAFTFAGLGSAVVTAGVFAAGLIVAAQSALPGDPLYSLKRGSETAATALRPHAHDQVMMNRASEINQLVASHRDPALITATLASYEQAVRRDPAGSYAAKEYCASMLRTAARQADPSTSAQIMQSLSRLHLDST